MLATSTPITAYEESLDSLSNSLNDLEQSLPFANHYEAQTIKKSIAYWHMRIATTEAAWNQYCNHPTIQAMQRIVTHAVSHYQSDFYTVDLPLMAEHPDWPFIWSVRDTGTTFIWAFALKEEPQRLIVRRQELDYALQYPSHAFYQGCLSEGIQRVKDLHSLSIAELDTLADLTFA